MYAALVSVLKASILCKRIAKILNRKNHPAVVAIIMTAVRGKSSQRIPIPITKTPRVMVRNAPSTLSNTLKQTLPIRSWRRVRISQQLEKDTGILVHEKAPCRVHRNAKGRHRDHTRQQIGCVIKRLAIHDKRRGQRALEAYAKQRQVGYRDE